MKNNIRKLDGYSSIFLDSIRLLCALIVVVGHCSQILILNWPLNEGIFEFGHGAVVIFFVLSGYVIAHTTSSKKRSLSDYLVARFSRLYSIYFPAIIITLLCALLSYLLNKSIYLQYDRGNNVVRYLLTLLFCNEIWFSSAAPPINGPFWSLGFEFWYYILFAIIYFKWDTKKGKVLFYLVCLFVGPKILAMLPIWCVGWLAYKVKTVRIKINAARTISIFSLIIACFLIKAFPAFPYQVGYKPLYMANAFLSDLLIALFVGFSFWILPTNLETKIKDSALIKKFRFFSNLTYPIYLFHFPMLVVYRCFLYQSKFSNLTNYCIGLITILGCCVMAGSYFELKKGWWYRFFKDIIFIKKYDLLNYVQKDRKVL